MLKKFATLAAVCALAAPDVLATASPAAAAGLSAPAADCNAHGRLTRTYPAAELRNALATMPAFINDYTSCHDVIQRQLLADIGQLKGGSGSGGGSFLPTWLLVVLAVLVLGGVGFGTFALRHRGTDGD